MNNNDIIRVYFAITIISELSDTFNGAFTNEFILKINTSDDEQTLKTNVENAGLLYVKRFGWDVYRVKDESLPQENDGVPLDSGNIAELLRLYGNKVTEVEQQETLFVRFNFPQDTPNPHHRFFESQGHSEMLQCPPYYGMGVEKAWSHGYTGSGVTIAVVDIGVEVSHEDLQKNFNKKLSFNFWDDNGNIEPNFFQSYPNFDGLLNHGNEMACLIAAVKGNELCSAGVAFNASFVALKAFELIPTYGNSLSMKNLSLALSHHIQSIDIYSCSFSFGSPFQSLQMDISKALHHGVTYGRQGKGSVFVFPAGDNRGSVFDCNVDPFVNNIYTFTIASVGINGSIPKYAIPCAATLASTFGNGRLLHEDKMITCSRGNTCVEAADGVSAATAIGAAIIALVMEANKNLTWRDLQHIIIKSSSLDSIPTKQLSTINGAGLKFHRYFGYGLMNATMMTSMAANWKNVAPQEVQSFKWTNNQTNKSPRFKEKIVIPEDAVCIESIEHVKVSVDFDTDNFSDIGFIIISPSNTRSVLMDLSRNKFDANKKNKNKVWSFTSTQLWGEKTSGVWRFVLQLRKTSLKKRVQLNSIVLTLYGPRRETPCKQESEMDDITPGTTLGDTDNNKDKNYLLPIWIMILIVPCLLFCFVCFLPSRVYRLWHLIRRL